MNPNDVLFCEECGNKFDWDTVTTANTEVAESNVFESTSFPEETNNAYSEFLEPEGIGDSFI